MQSINFYLDSYKPKPLSFDSRFAFLSIVLCLFGMLIFGWIQTNEVSQLEIQASDKKVQLDKQQQQLIAITKQLKINSVEQNLQEQLAEKQKQLNSYRQLISIVNLPMAFNQVKFSRILNDLSEQTVDHLWLTKIDIRANNLSINGTTTKADNIPVYVDKLKVADSLKRHFDELKIERVDADNLINFELLNGRLLNE